MANNSYTNYSVQHPDDVKKTYLYIDTDIVQDNQKKYDKIVNLLDFLRKFEAIFSFSILCVIEELYRSFTIKTEDFKMFSKETQTKFNELNGKLLKIKQEGEYIIFYPLFSTSSIIDETYNIVEKKDTFPFGIKYKEEKNFSYLQIKKDNKIISSYMFIFQYLTKYSLFSYDPKNVSFVLTDIPFFEHEEYIESVVSSFDDFFFFTSFDLDLLEYSVEYPTDFKTAFADMVLDTSFDEKFKGKYLDEYHTRPFYKNALELLSSIAEVSFKNIAFCSSPYIDNVDGKYAIDNSFAISTFKEKMEDKNIEVIIIQHSAWVNDYHATYIIFVKKTGQFLRYNPWGKGKDIFSNDIVKDLFESVTNLSGIGDNIRIVNLSRGLQQYDEIGLCVPLSFIFMCLFILTYGKYKIDPVILLNCIEGVIFKVLELKDPVQLEYIGYKISKLVQDRRFKLRTGFEYYQKGGKDVFLNQNPANTQYLEEDEEDEEKEENEIELMKEVKNMYEGKYEKCTSPYIKTVLNRPSQLSDNYRQKYFRYRKHVMLNIGTTLRYYKNQNTLNIMSSIEYLRFMLMFDYDEEVKEYKEKYLKKFYDKIDSGHSYIENRIKYIGLNLKNSRKDEDTEEYTEDEEDNKDEDIYIAESDEESYERGRKDKRDKRGKNEYTEDEDVYIEESDGDGDKDKEMTF